MTNGAKGPPYLRRLVLKDYKSVAACSIQLRALTVFVGPNGSGKSNILDSMRFVADSLRNSLEFALRERGGLNDVRRRSKGHPHYFGIRMEIALPGGDEAAYAFQIGVPQPGGFEVQKEQCKITSGRPPYSSYEYLVEKGRLAHSSLELQSAIEPDRLFLGLVSGRPEFRPLYDFLTRMGFYNLNPDRIRDLQSPNASDVLTRDGGNAASLLKALAGEDGVKRRIEEYLAAVSPGVKGVDHKSIGPKETIEFRQDVVGDASPWRFLAANMSDGTVRALGVLMALFQVPRSGYGRIPLVGIEEPEAALHPAALSALADAILEATKSTQVLITSHSPDLLDNESIQSESIQAVVSEKGATIAGGVDQAGPNRVACLQN